MVMATQNPIEQEGTYPLPEAQMDRFLMKIFIEYPDEESESKIIKMVRGEEMGGARQSKSQDEVIPHDIVFQARVEIKNVHVSDIIEKYFVDLIFATRFPDRYEGELKSWIQVGASPRGGLSLDKSSRAHAWLQGRDHVTPDDVRAVINEVLRHRLILTYEANAEGITPDEVISEIVKQVAVA